jgi:hypothetical protein
MSGAVKFVADNHGCGLGGRKRTAAPASRTAVTVSAPDRAGAGMDTDQHLIGIDLGRRPCFELKMVRGVSDHRPACSVRGYFSFDTNAWCL